jgi:Family of unknown function (DUF5678)
VSTIVDEDLEQLDMDSEWLHSHYDELLEKFNQEYVAIRNQQVIASANDLDELKQDLREKNIDYNNILVEFIRDKRNQLT